jgi:hypothetical protein
MHAEGAGMLDLSGWALWQTTDSNKESYDIMVAFAQQAVARKTAGNRCTVSLHRFEPVNSG